MLRGYKGYTPQATKETFVELGDPAMHVGRYTIELPSVVGKHDGTQWGQQSDEKYRQGFQLTPYINRPLIKSRLMVESDVDKSCNPLAGRLTDIQAQFVSKTGPLQPSAEDIRQELLSQAPTLDPNGNPLPANLQQLANIDPSAAIGYNNTNHLPQRYSRQGMPMQQINTRVQQEMQAVGIPNVNQNTGLNPGRIQGNSYGVNLAVYDPYFVNFAHAQINYPPTYNGNRDPLSSRIHSFLTAHVASYFQLLHKRESHAGYMNEHEVTKKQLKKLSQYDTELNGYPGVDDMMFLHHHIGNKTPLYRQYLGIVDKYHPIFDIGKIHDSLHETADLQRFHNIAFSMRMNPALIHQVRMIEIYNPYIKTAGP